MVNKTILLLFSILFIVSVGYGQSGQTGAINGTVTDPDGVSLPGITVILKSPALVLPQLKTVTNANGVYRFIGLPPGIYEITYIQEGMNTLIRKGIVVNAGKTYTVDVGMTLKSVQESIIVTGKAPTIDRQSTKGSTNMSVEFLKAVPTTRSMDDYFHMAPGVTGYTAFGSPEIGNSYNLDGVNIGDAATGTQGVYFGIDIMEELSVSSGGIPAEYGNVQGAVVNVVTKSGGNTFHGSLSFYLDHESFQSDNTQGTELEERKVGSKIQYEPVITLGGPIVKNKLWFFTNLSMRISEEYVPGYPADKEEEIAPKVKRYYPFVKLTYAPSQRDKFVLSYNFYDNRNNHREADEYMYEETTRLQTNATNVFNAQWTRLFGEDIYTNFKIALIRREFNIDAKVNKPHYYDYFTEISWGGWWRNHDDYGRDRDQANIDVTTYVDNLAGSHELKFGGEYSAFHSSWFVDGAKDPITGDSYVMFLGEDYYYLGLELKTMDRKEDVVNLHFFLQDTWSVSNNLTINWGLRYEYNSLWYPVQGAGVDETIGPWTVNRSVTKRTKAYAWKNLIPRIGVVYDLFSDGKTLLKASYGRYLIPNQVGFANLAHPNGWFGVIKYYSGGDPTQIRAYSPWAIPGDVCVVGHEDYPLKTAWTDEITVGIAHELWEDWSIGLRYIKKWDKDLVHTVDSAQLDLKKLMETGELDWSKNWVSVAAVDPYNNQPVTFYSQIDTTAIQQHVLNPPGAEREYDGVELTIDKRYSRNWQISFSYVYSNSRGLINTDRGSQSLSTSGLFQNPNDHIYMIGRFPLERRHFLKLMGLIKGPWGINISGYLAARSGRRYAREIRSEDLGIELNQGDETILAETRGFNGYPWITTLDLKLEKAFNIGNVTLAVFSDCFNVFNDNSATEYYLISSNEEIKYRKLEEIVDPRIFRLGARIEF